MQQGQLLIGQQCVVHPPMQQARRQRFSPTAAHNSSLNLVFRQLGKKVMTIEALAHQGDKKITRLKLSAVGANPSHQGIGFKAAALRRSPGILQLTQRQGHPTNPRSNRIMPPPTRADRPSRSPCSLTN